jgi:hypothetical protein
MRNYGIGVCSDYLILVGNLVKICRLVQRFKLGDTKKKKEEAKMCEFTNLSLLSTTVRELKM